MSRALSVTHGRFGRATLYDLDRGYVTHAHREAQLVFHVLGQPAPLTVQKDPFLLCAGHAVACNSWEPHDYAPPPRFEGQRSFTLYVDCAWYEAFGGPSAGPLRFGRRVVEVTAPVARAVTKLLQMMTEPAGPQLFEGYVFELVKRCCEQSRDPCEEAACARRAAPDFRVRKAMRLLERPGGAVDLGAVAREAGMSRPNFFRLFREHTGMTPKLFFNTLRMEQALADLARTGKSVTEIGLELGFASHSSFSRFFALNAGIAPTDYRAALRACA